MPYVVKSADKTIIHPGEYVTYTYEVFNDTGIIYIDKIEDNVFGLVWSGLLIILPNSSEKIEIQREGDCNTITNRARAEWSPLYPADWAYTEWSNFITVKCLPYPPQITKSADKESVNPGEIVTYTYEVYNANPEDIWLQGIIDNVLGLVFEGNIKINSGTGYSVEFSRAADCTTITNRAKAFGSYDELGQEQYTSYWSNEITVICTPSPDWRDIAQAVNTKEDVEVLNGLTQGNHAWEEIHALRGIKVAKILDLI